MWVVFVGTVLFTIISGVVVAQSGNDYSSTFSGKVASTLGLDEASVNDAMKQAKQEIVQEKLDKAVEAGKITPEKAQRILEWHQATPEEKKARKIERFKSGLDKAVEAGKITPEEAQTKLESFQENPDSKYKRGKHGPRKRGYGKSGMK